MKTKLYRPTFNSHPAKGRVALLFVALLAFGDLAVFALQEPKPAPAAEQQEQDAPKIPNDQLDSLVAPIALYPDPLLSQVLVASTYPLEIVQLHQWLEQRGSFMNDKAVAEAVQKQDWDPSIRAMAVLPEVVKRLSDNIKWTSDLGNAFLAQQGDVMDAVQRMRAKAKNAGNLKSNEQMKVETREVESKTVVVIEQSNPEVVYVPSYNPTVVWGAMYYPYPPIYYPAAGYYAGAAIGFGVGVAIGAAWGGGGGQGRGGRPGSGGRTWSQHPDLKNKKVAMGTKNMAKGPAMSREEAIRSIEAGIELVEEELARGIDILGTGDMGIGNTTPSSAITAAITGADVASVTGQGNGPRRGRVEAESGGD